MCSSLSFFLCFSWNSHYFLAFVFPDFIYEFFIYVLISLHFLYLFYVLILHYGFLYFIFYLLFYSTECCLYFMNTFLFNPLNILMIFSFFIFFFLLHRMFPARSCALFVGDCFFHASGFLQTPRHLWLSTHIYGSGKLLRGYAHVLWELLLAVSITVTQTDWSLWRKV